MEPAAVTALRDTRQAITDEIVVTKATLRRLKAELREVRAALRAAEHSLPPGEMTRFLMATLRGTPTPMTTRELALALMAQQGMDAADRWLVAVFVRRVGKRLRLLRARRVVTGRRAWEIMRPA